MKMENLRKLLSKDKYEFTTWNKYLIPMDLFKSFITVPLKINKYFLGNYNGWTQCINEEHKLVIGGAVYHGIHYLNHVQYGLKRDNPYNNYVNPFYLFDIMNDEGKKFFMDYYREDIEKILKDKKSDIEFIKESIRVKEIELNELLKEYKPS